MNLEPLYTTSIKDRRNSPVCFDYNVVIGVKAIADHWLRNSCCVVISPYFIGTQITSGVISVRQEILTETHG
jgi:hypothetical protein